MGIATAIMLSGASMASSADPIREDAIRMAEEALSRELGAATPKLSVEEASPAQWRDTSLGCPRKGMVYSPVVTPGYRVVLRDEGRLYVVHVGGGRAVRCETPAAAPKAR